MILARNQVTVLSNYDRTVTLESPGPDRGFTKLDCQVYGGFPIIVQIEESYGASFPNPTDTEILLNPGFNSRGLPTFYGFRFKGYNNVGGIVIDFVAMAE